MTRKDYIKLAAAIHAASAATLPLFAKSAEHIPEYVREAYAAEIAVVLAADNPNFDRARFLTACGLEG